MIKFLLKGLIQDRSRSLLPIIVVSSGAALTVVLYCWITGFLGESIKINANFNTGHLKVMTRAYAKEAEQIPNDLALIGVEELREKLKKSNPEIDWVERIRFGGLMDIPDSVGETLAQGPVFGWAVDLFSPGSKEKERLNLNTSLVTGKIPERESEALVSDDFVHKYNLRMGDKFTLFGSTMDGSLAFKNFTIAGTVRFGVAAIDRGALIIDIKDAQIAFNMEDAAGEILGFFKDGIYNEEKASSVSADFNNRDKSNTDEFEPEMLRLRDQSGMTEYLEYTKSVGAIMTVIFIFALSVVLWNAGLLSGLRRYNEFGIRLALGEEKSHIYKTMIYEGLLVGTIGSVIGASIGLGISYYLQVVGIDMSDIMQKSSLMMPSVLRTIITPTAFYIGFIPGLFSTVLGNAISGIGIYKRKTAQLFKELEA